MIPASSLFGPGGRSPAVCPHCWMVNPGPFRLCGRCGADMETLLQETGGLRRTAPVQSPVPVGGGARFSPLQRLLLGAFVALFALGHLVHLLPGRIAVVSGAAAGAGAAETGAGVAASTGVAAGETADRSGRRVETSDRAERAR